MKESHARSLVKSLSFRIFATLTTVIIVFLLTGNFLIAAAVALPDFISKLALYYIHERAWHKIKWGLVE